MMPYSKSVHSVRDAAILTTSYVAGNTVSMDRQNYIGILVEVTLGSLTTVELKVESSVDNGATYGVQTTENVSGGTIQVSAGEYQFSASGNYWIVINPMLADTVKISAKGTGTVTGSSVAVTAVVGSV